MKPNFKLIKQDIRRSAFPILCVIGAILFFNIVVGKICLARILFGIPCPGCGLTRAYGRLLHGHVLEATHIHPFWSVPILLLVAFLANRYLVYSPGLSKKILAILKTCVIIAIILAIFYYIYRMVYWFPNEEPMTYDSQNIIEMLRNMFNI